MTALNDFSNFPNTGEKIPILLKISKT